MPFYKYQNERNQLVDWAKEKGQEKIEHYWKEIVQVLTVFQQV